MKNNCFRTFLIVALSCAAHIGFAQGDLAFEPEASLPTRKKPSTTSTPSRSNTGFHKKFPQLFTGWAIEIAMATYPMDKSNPLFRQFGNVMYEKLPEGGYSYLIMANFSSKDAALKFVQTVVRPKSEHAQLIQFTEGKRKVVRD
ncbi:MAG: hypothetical protein MUC59_03505 [Saprospiraceae bacterium]|jgi:hypothetical protein|nr:hypothetical protein [Saprospiraceae bacterium]